MFNTEFCIVDYIEKENVVLLTWKKRCSSNNYRNPVNYALKLLESNKDSNFIVDARNGFEDEKEDVEWCISEFIPNLSQTDCKEVIFIMNVVNDIEGEMDMWTKEFMKHFRVSRVETFEAAISMLNNK
ncbi:MAG: hypothetical protein ACRDA5_10555 [Clostridium sp.]